MKKETLFNKLVKNEYRLKNEIYNEIMNNFIETVLEILEINYLSTIKKYRDIDDSDKLRNEVLKNINYNKLKKILPKYIKMFKKGQYGFLEDTIDLVPLTNKVQKEIWQQIKLR